MDKLPGFGDVSWLRVDKGAVDRDNRPAIMRISNMGDNTISEIFAIDQSDGDSKEVFICIDTEYDPDSIYMVNIKDIFENGLVAARSFVSVHKDRPQNGAK